VGDCLPDGLALSMASDETPGEFVPGIFSQAGRETAFEIENLQSQLNLDGQNTGHGKDAVEDPKAKAKAKSAAAAKGKEDLEPRTPGGQLAKAIAKKLATEEKEDSRKAADEAKAAADQIPEPKERPTACFGSQGKDAPWATKFTASSDLGVINHRNEQLPGPVWYRMKYDVCNMTLGNAPASDFHTQTVTHAIERPEGKGSPYAFMTGLDVDDKDAVQALTAQQRGMLKKASSQPAIPPPKRGDPAMSLNSERGPLGKIGRIHVMAHEVSCAYDGDLLDQDIKGYPKQRIPRWDFEANIARSKKPPGDQRMEPGKYFDKLDDSITQPRSGIGFGKALRRSQSVKLMGYSAPTANLHPEDKKGGVLPDRSACKDAVRPRVTSVNNFDKEMTRPPLSLDLPNYHDDKDPVAHARVCRQEQSYDADTSDCYVTHRRDICPTYHRMIGRGKEAVQGLRSISTDLAVRGSVGIGFKEIRNDLAHSVEQREGRHADGTKDRMDKGPQLHLTTQHLHNRITEMTYRGAPLLKGFGEPKKPPQKQSMIGNPMVDKFKRSASLPGFTSSSKFGGTRVVASQRSSIAIPGWSPVDLDSVAIPGS